MKNKDSGQYFLKSESVAHLLEPVYFLLSIFTFEEKVIKSFFPNIGTYRRFRFALYMEIMEDSKKMSPQLAFSKWKKICDHDMRECEKDYLRIDSFI